MAGIPLMLLTGAMLLCLAATGCDNSEGATVVADAGADVCVPDCTKKMCGADGCGGICGVCKAFEHCTPNSHQCISGPCIWGFERQCCVGEMLLMCPGGKYIEEDCSERLHCGWGTMSKLYHCNTEGGQDPSGKYPRSCDDRFGAAGGLPPDGAKNGQCQHAKKVPFAADKATIQGTTSGAANEFGKTITCGQAKKPLVGAQRYYQVELVKGQGYMIQFTPLFFFARLAIFSSGCTPAAINSACSSTQGQGMVTSTIHRGQTYYGVFTAARSGPYILAVDSTAPAASGAFVLTLEKTQLYSNNTCAKAELLDLSGGSKTVTGNTIGADDEFGLLTCGGKETLSGPQLYYQLLLTPGHFYELLLLDKVGLDLALFGPSCDPIKIDKACASLGVSGDHRHNATALQFRASQALMTVAVDSKSSLHGGAFTLTAQRHHPPTNAACAAASPVDLSSGAATLSGTTTGAPNEFGGAVVCDLKPGTALYGNQVYYTLNLTAGKPVEFSLKTNFNNAFMYLFSGACSAAAINAGCGSAGKSGFVAGTSASTKVSFTPPATGSYTLAIDTLKVPTSSQGHGAFTVEVKVGS